MSTTDLIEELVHRASENEDKLTTWEVDFVEHIEGSDDPTGPEMEKVNEILDKLRLPANDYMRARNEEVPPRGRW